MTIRYLPFALLISVVGLLAGADSCRVPPPVEVGRYWAHITGYGTAPGAGTFWIEYRPSAITSWVFVAKTPPRTVTAGSDLSTMSEWLYGLVPGTSYDFRACTADTAGTVVCDETEPPFKFTTSAPTAMRWVSVDPSNSRHLILDNGQRFVPWGNNYVFVHGTSNTQQLVETDMYSAAGLARIGADLHTLTNVAPPDGALNVVRMHLQLHTFLVDPTTVNREAFARFAQVIELAENRNIYVMVTGLNYFFPGHNPPWVGEQTSEAEHWATQSLWWNSMATALANSPGVFAYDLMNEPYTNGGSIDASGKAHYTIVGPTEFCDYGADPATGRPGTCFGQYITATAGTRPPATIAADWAGRMVHAIRFSGFFQNDARHLVTVGTGAFGMNNPFNSSTAVHQVLDILAPHLYPDANNGQDAINLAAAIAALTTKPIIAGETFTFGPADRLISNACNDNTVQGWIGQWDGRVLGDPCGTLGCFLFDAWYAIQRNYGPTIRGGGCPARIP